LKERRASKGQIFALILLIIFGLIVLSAILSILSTRVRVAPRVKEAFWLVDGQEVSAATIDEEVEAHIVIEATEQYVGSIVFRVKKDVRLWWDSDFAISTVPVDLAGGEEKSLEITFTPDETSRGGLTGLRGYFIEVEFRATRTTWGMENTYPPRLTVTD